MRCRLQKYKADRMTQTSNRLGAGLAQRLSARSARIGIIGMGYVGQPLAIAANRAGFDVTGFDVAPAKVTLLNCGEQVLRPIPAAQIRALLETRRFRATA